ncbi:hypothetical protein CcaverHIS002_0113370 [Cutaneotrichosporon cavernicola]|uniref:Haloacid dehalogenase n=1 Tax=Cutaneotrichosporon cavernicola TaxID=279322 RepID=A0AA48ICX1_9TREE|nr:uncharacterized protein CcaverHIS019_0113240 [Cutaneotrichosporon cavernicola]BEI80808.1 hypothetical protein CcaverHIS002_0113370 [Cutaneotrichosporon cavernicola]BEI88606.1 hypothetical protein CcaverHIS019_0113240 [Cutaneotrichosporon cavernicola]BEI96379.1 hypothetical protein CcaverHIS631_0113280 [Cutaneotrichosporon cavernicola]BEJ04151.1 hypothetical protein CcaverHIS641_0113260 [Cutaneotrichosporon cavernicola]
MAEQTPPVPKVLAFDVFGTVVDWHTTIAREVESLVPGIDGDAFALQWRQGYAPAMAATMASGTFRVLDDLHMDILRTIAPPLSESQLSELNRAWHRLDPWPEAVAALNRLKSRFVITPLSNGGIGLLTYMAKRAGLPWDLILCAEVFGAYKPDHRTYQGVARVLGVKPEEVMMVAAHEKDLDAAQDAGLQTAYIERVHEFGAKRTKDVSPSPRHPLHFRDLAALADYFGC